MAAFWVIRRMAPELRRFLVAAGRTAAVILVAALICTACAHEKSPEEEVKAFVKAGEEAAEARDAGDISKLISDRYLDRQRRTKRDIVAIVARYLFVNKNIHLLTRVDRLRFPEPNRAECRIYVAMSGQNISDLDSLLNMQADLYRFDVKLVREDDAWKLIGAEWHHARPAEFF